MKLTASSHRFCFFCLSRDSRDEAALSDSVPFGAWRKERWRVLHFLPYTAYNSCDSCMGCIVYLQIAGSNKIPGMPCRCLLCLEVAIFQQIHLWGGKSVSNQSCESCNTSTHRCGQELWAPVALWARVGVVTTGTFLEHVCPAVVCGGRHSQRPSQTWCRRSTSERRKWLLLWVVQQPNIFDCCPGVQALTVRKCFAVIPVDMLAVEVVNIETEEWEWQLVWVVTVEVCRR